MRVLFASRKWSIASWLIRFFTFSKFSHVAIRISDELVVHSTFADGGVHCISLNEFAEKYPGYIEIDIPLPDEKAAINYAMDQIGKPYDWTAIVGMVFQRKWHEEDSWFCNEYWEAIAKIGGRPRFRDEVHRITPQQSWAVL